MPPPKDPKKLEEYKKKMSRIAKEKGYGKWMKGRHLSQETKDKMSKTQLKRITPEERERRSIRAKENGYGKWMKGRTANPKFVAYAKSRKGKTYEEIYGIDRAEAEATKRKESNIGVTKTYASIETREKLKTGKMRKGKTYEEIYGKKKAKEEAIKRSKGHLKRWEGKKRSGCRDKINGDHKYIKWRKAIFKRDNYTCQDCGEKGGELQAHHIRHWATNEKLRYRIQNGITLCKTCHGKHHPEIKGLFNKG